MKTKNKTRYLQSILGAILAVSAGLVLSCEQLDGSSVGAPVGKGSVVLTVSTGSPPGSAVKTILPTEEPAFNRYELAFTPQGSAAGEPVDVTPDELESGYTVELKEGSWTVEVTAFRKFSDDLDAKEYAAAWGESDPFTVSAGAEAATPVAVMIKPIPIDEASELTGRFTYTISLDSELDGVTVTKLELGGVDLTTGEFAFGTEYSIEKTPGYYELSIVLAKGDLSAGLLEEVHIYAGLESIGDFKFTAEDFTQTVYLAGTFSLYGGATVETEPTPTIEVYSDADHKVKVGTTGTDVTAYGWLVGIPVADIGTGPLYLRATVEGSDGTTYKATGSTTGAVPKAGARDITLESTAVLVSDGDVTASALETAIGAALAASLPVELGDVTITGTGEVNFGTADVTVTGELVIPADVTVAVGGSLDLTAADAAVAGTVTVADGGTIKAPALGPDGIPVDGKQVSFNGDGKVELAKGATGYYGELLFVSEDDGGFYKWGTTESATVTLKAGNVTEVTAGEVIAVANTGIAAGTSIVVADGAKLSIGDGVTYVVGGTLDVVGDVDLSKGNVVVPGTVAVADGGTLKVATPGSQQAAEAFFGPDGTGSLVLEKGSAVSRQNGEVEELYVGDTDSYIYKWGGETGELVLAKNSQTLESGTLIVNKDESIQTGYTATVAEGAVLQIADDATFTMRGALNVTGGLDVLDGGELIVEDGASGILKGTIEVASGGVLKDQKPGGGSFWAEDSTGSYIINAGAQAYSGTNAVPTIGKADDTGVLLALTSGTLTMHKDGYELTGEGALKTEGFFVTDLLIAAGSVLTIDEGGILGAVYGDDIPGVTGEPATGEKEAAKIVVTKPNGYIDIYALANPPVYTSNISGIPHNFYTAGGTKIAKNGLTGTTFAWAADAGGQDVAGWKASGGKVSDDGKFELPEDVTLDITLNPNEGLSWLANTEFTATATEGFHSYKWILDGAEIEGQTSNELKLEAGELSVSNHTLTVVVTKEEGGAEYDKYVTFTVVFEAAE